MAGYSKTPLQKKLGLKPPLKLVTVAAPDGFRDWLGPLPEGITFGNRIGARVQAAHLFVTRRRVLEEKLERLRGRLDQDGFVWVSWPKKSSDVPSEVDGDVIRAVALPMGFVDIKVCAVNEVWSGLKLVIRRSERRSG